MGASRAPSRGGGTSGGMVRPRRRSARAHLLGWAVHRHDRDAPPGPLAGRGDRCGLGYAHSARAALGGLSRPVGRWRALRPAAVDRPGGRPGLHRRPRSLGRRRCGGTARPRPTDRRRLCQHGRRGAAVPRRRHPAPRRHHRDGRRLAGPRSCGRPTRCPSRLGGRTRWGRPGGHCGWARGRVGGRGDRARGRCARGLVGPSGPCGGGRRLVGRHVSGTVGPAAGCVVLFDLAGALVGLQPHRRGERRGMGRLRRPPARHPRWSSHVVAQRRPCLRHPRQPDRASGGDHRSGRPECAGARHAAGCLAGGRPGRLRGGGGAGWRVDGCGRARTRRSQRGDVGPRSGTARRGGPQCAHDARRLAVCGNRPRSRPGGPPRRAAAHRRTACYGLAGEHPRGCAGSDRRWAVGGGGGWCAHGRASAPLGSGSCRGSRGRQPVCGGGSGRNHLGRGGAGRAAGCVRGTRRLVAARQGVRGRRAARCRSLRGRHRWPVAGRRRPRPLRTGLHAPQRSRADRERTRPVGRIREQHLPGGGRRGVALPGDGRAHLSRTSAGRRLGRHTGRPGAARSRWRGDQRGRHPWRRRRGCGHGGGRFGRPWGVVCDRRGPGWSGGGRTGGPGHPRSGRSSGCDRAGSRRRPCVGGHRGRGLSGLLAVLAGLGASPRDRRGRSGRRTGHGGPHTEQQQARNRPRPQGGVCHGDGWSGRPLRGDRHADGQ